PVGRVGAQAVGDEAAEVTVGSDQQDSHRAAPSTSEAAGRVIMWVLLRGCGVPAVGWCRAGLPVGRDVGGVGGDGCPGGGHAAARGRASGGGRVRPGVRGGDAPVRPPVPGSAGGPAVGRPGRSTRPRPGGVGGGPGWGAGGEDRGRRAAGGWGGRAGHRAGSGGEWAEARVRRRVAWTSRTRAATPQLRVGTAAGCQAVTRVSTGVDSGVRPGRRAAKTVVRASAWAVAAHASSILGPWVKPWTVRSRARWSRAPVARAPETARGSSRAVAHRARRPARAQRNRVTVASSRGRTEAAKSS